MNRSEIAESIGRSPLHLGKSYPVFATFLHPGGPSYFLIVTSIPQENQDVARSRDEVANSRVSLRAPVAVR